mgnify:CR=1 FL=1
MNFNVAAHIDSLEKKRIHVGISDMRISDDPKVVLVTHSLGSCLGVTAYDPVRKMGGMIHCLLPQMDEDSSNNSVNPYMYVVPGVEQMLTEMSKRGAVIGRLIIKAAGGGDFVNSLGHFNIGKSNTQIFQEWITHRRLKLSNKIFGGNNPKTLYLYIDGGRCLISSLGKTKEL